MELFEDLLKRALQRKQPSAGFTERVLALSQDQPCAVRRRLALPIWFGPALAALLVFAVGLGYERYRERQEGERAKEQLVVALRLTGTKLQQVRSKVVEIGVAKGMDQ